MQIQDFDRLPVNFLLEAWTRCINYVAERIRKTNSISKDILLFLSRKYRATL